MINIGQRLMGLASIFGFLCSCGAAATDKSAEPVTHFKWYSVATAPRDYAMEVINGTFFYKG